MIERFLSTYKDGFEVYLNPSEKDEIIEEIERLNKMLEETIKEYEHKQYITDLITENGIICQKNKEIERLNNIINELEKWLKKEMKDLNVDTYVEYQFILNKIKELKGSDKE